MKAHSTPAISTAPAAGTAKTPEPPASTVLWLLRHAEVEAAYQRVFGGKIDMGLSPRGHQQAEALARFLHGGAFDAVYSSPMRRVRLTLAPALVNGFPRPVVLPDLREVDFGDWTGLGWDQVLERFGVSAYSWLERLERAEMPGAEDAAGLRARVEPCLRRILEEHAGGRVIIACHGGIVRVLLSILLDLPLSRMSAFDVDYASATRVSVTGGEAVVQLLNYTPWKEVSHA